MVRQISLLDAQVATGRMLPVRLVDCISSQEQHAIDQAISDGVITAKLRASLTTSPVTGHYDVHIETIQGMVTLSGYVESDEVRRTALQIAYDIDGVRQVQDLLDVRRPR